MMDNRGTHATREWRHEKLLRQVQQLLLLVFSVSRIVIEFRTSVLRESLRVPWRVSPSSMTCACLYREFSPFISPFNREACIKLTFPYAIPQFERDPRYRDFRVRTSRDLRRFSTSVFALPSLLCVAGITSRRYGQLAPRLRNRTVKVSSSCVDRNSSGNSGSLPNSLQLGSRRLALSRCGEPSPLLVMRLLQSHPHSATIRDQPLPRKQWILCPYGAYSRVPITVESLLRIPVTRLRPSEIHLMAGVNAERNSGNER